MITARDLAFSYRNGGNTLSGMSFTLEPGHCLALLGNNGAGKSTLLKCLNRILEPQSGVVEVCGLDVRELTRNRIAKRMAYVSQHNCAARLTVFDSVLLGRKPFIKMNPTEDDLRITESAIARMGLRDYTLRYTDELSGGELQKVVLARALAQQPHVLLLDEPTSNLDLCNQHEVMKLVSGIAKADHIAVVIVIHDLNLAARYCDRFLFMKNGTVYQYGDSSIITDRLISEVYNIPARVTEIAGRKLILVE
jgi:iron complex transport system ATP-binding protein